MTASTICFSQDTIPSRGNLERHPHWLLLKINRDLALMDKLKRDVEIGAVEISRLDSANEYLEKTVTELKKISVYHSAMAANNQMLMYQYQTQAAELQKIIKKLRRSRTWERIGFAVILILVAI